jgi:hypothetical protein
MFVGWCGCREHALPATKNTNTSSDIEILKARRIRSGIGLAMTLRSPAVPLNDV